MRLVYSWFGLIDRHVSLYFSYKFINFVKIKIKALIQSDKLTSNCFNWETHFFHWQKVQSLFSINDFLKMLFIWVNLFVQKWHVNTEQIVYTTDFLSNLLKWRHSIFRKLMLNIIFASRVIYWCPIDLWYFSILFR